MLETLVPGFPVLLFISYLLFPRAFVKVSKHPLGKMIAVVIICMYTYHDMTYGLFACLVIILFYHQQMESFLSQSTTDYERHLPKSSSKENSVHFDENNNVLDYTKVDEAYPVKNPPIKRVSEGLFRKEKCGVNSKVQHKNQDLKNHLVTHVHPELNFRDGGECNPCDPTCHFTMIENKLNAVKPVNTRDTTWTGSILTVLGYPSKEPFDVRDTYSTPF
jgi:hypothetical protein